MLEFHGNQLERLEGGEILNLNLITPTYFMQQNNQEVARQYIDLKMGEGIGVLLIMA